MALVAANTPWMVWNLMLAAVPALLSFQLFRPGVRRRAAWWLGLGIFVAFLPNAPYVLTDVIHLATDIRGTESNPVVAALVGQYGCFFLAGLACYAVSLARLERWLRNAGWSLPRLLGLDVTLHVLCAVGVFLGRVFRLNSWDLVSHPHVVVSVFRVPKPQTVVFLLVTTVALAVSSAALRAAAGVRAVLSTAE